MREGIKKGDILYYYNVHKARCGDYAVSYNTFSRRLLKMSLHDAIYMKNSQVLQAESVRRHNLDMNRKAEDRCRAKLIEAGVQCPRKSFYKETLETFEPKIYPEHRGVIVRKRTIRQRIKDLFNI